MAGRDYIDRIAQTLLLHGITPQITDEMMQEALLGLRRHASHPSLQKWTSATCLFEALVSFLPETPSRLVWFDAEMDAVTYSNLVQRFADATDGEWSPSQVSEEIEILGAMGYYRITVDFDVCGEAVHGEWTAAGLKWVDHGFLDLIEEGPEKHLSGEFVEIPMHDQTMLFAYLPRLVVRELEALLDQFEQEYSNFVTFAKEI